MPSPAPLPAQVQPCLHLQTLDRGDGLLGLRPCGPVRAPARTPLFGARGPQVTVAWLGWRPAGAPAGPGADGAAEHAALARLHAAGLHPLPADALQWRGEPALPPSTRLLSLVREADFAGSDLRGSILRGCKLARSDFSAATSLCFDPAVNDARGARIAIETAVLLAMQQGLSVAGFTPAREP